jgi:two-component system, sensor histidine kinase and response regulator
MRILLADDQDEIRLLTARQLEQDGHSVVAVSNGEEALAEFERSSFDILLLDEHMPAMGGVQVLHAVRNRGPGKGPMVIAVTGYNTEHDRLRLLREGFDSVIGKPFRLDRLDVTLRQVLDSRNSSAGLDPGTAPAAVPTRDLLSSVGGDQELLQRMIGTFLRDTPKRLAQVDAAIRLKRPENLAFSAHALKGSVAIFGAPLAHQYCEQLEELGRRKDLSGTDRILLLLKEEIAKLEANLRGYAGQNSPAGPGVQRKRKRPDSAAKRKPR